MPNKIKYCFFNNNIQQNKNIYDKEIENYMFVFVFHIYVSMND